MMPFAAAWRDLEASRLRKSSQTDKESTVWYHLYVEAKKIQQTDDYSKKKKKHTQRHREQTSDYHWGEG